MTITRPRFVRSIAPLTDEQIAATAPSVLADAAHSSRSSRYAFIHNAPVLAAMRSAGYQPIEVSQGGSRIEGKDSWTKHLVRFRHQDHMGDGRQNSPEIVLVNSHDGTSSYQMMAGIFRLVCSNGLILGDSAVPCIKVGHRGDIAHKVVTAADQIIDQTGKVFATIDQWRCRLLSNSEIRQFAKSASALRFPNAEHADWATVTRRFEDGEATLWNVFNRVQENILNGGPDRRLVSQTGSIKWRKVRPVKHIAGVLKLNRDLWELADKLNKGEELVLPA